MEKKFAIRKREPICGGEARGNFSRRLEIKRDEDEFIILQIRKSWQMTVYGLGRSCRLGHKRFTIHAYTYPIYIRGDSLRLRERARTGFHATTLLKSCTPRLLLLFKAAPYLRLHFSVAPPGDLSLIP